MIVKDHKKLRTVIALREVTYRELADAVGWKSHSYLYRLARGQVRKVDPEAAVKIAQYLGVDLDDLFAPRGSGIFGPKVNDRETAA